MRFQKREQGEAKREMKGQVKGEVKRVSLPVVESAALAGARGGLKAERVEGSEPAGPGGG